MNDLGSLIKDDVEFDGFICYTHKAEFVFSKKEFFKKLGLNVDAFYGLTYVQDDNEMITLTLAVRSDNNNFFLKNDERNGIENNEQFKKTHVDLEQFADQMPNKIDWNNISDEIKAFIAHEYKRGYYDSQRRISKDSHDASRKPHPLVGGVVDWSQTMKENKSKYKIKQWLEVHNDCSVSYFFDHYREQHKYNYKQHNEFMQISQILCQRYEIEITDAGMVK